jgi:Xaa-Pro aminopeptidase
MVPTDTALQAETAGRREKFAVLLQRCGLPAAIISSEANFAYLTGYLTPSWANGSRPMALVMLADGSCTAVLSAAEAERLVEVAPDIDVEPYLQPAVLHDDRHSSVDFAHAALDSVLACLDRRGMDRLGAELAPFATPTLSASLIDHACRELRATAEDIAAALIVQRSRKSASEVDRLRSAGTMLGSVFDEFARHAIAGATERELAAALSGLAASAGADRVGYAVVAASPSGSLLGRPRREIWRAGSILHVDVGLVVDGYWADFCRELVSDTPPSAAAQAFERIVAAVRAGREAAHAGALACDVARAIAAALPVPDERHMFGRLGHGIGLELAEPPSLHISDETPLMPGMTLCIEPAAWFDGVGQLVAEEMVLVRDGEPELLSPETSPKLLEVERS